MMDLLIIADDFTGALDTGVQFSKKGIETLVTTDRHIDFSLLSEDVRVLALDAETRHIDAREAYEIVAGLARRALRAGVRCVYKKTDSTLRGNIGAELSALLAHCGRDALMFIPAFPKNGRVTQDGVQYVDGVPLHESAFAEDPIDPVRISGVAEIIRTQSDVPVRRVPVDDCERAAGEAHAERTICLFDATTDEDLLRIGEALRDKNKLDVLAGCAGFAEYLPQLLGLHVRAVQARPVSGNTLIVSGSVNQASLDQVRQARQQGHLVLTLTPAQLLGRSAEDERARKALADRLVALLLDGKRTILASATSRAELLNTSAYAHEHGIGANQIAVRAAESIGEVVGCVMATGAVQNLVVFGGDTLLSVMEAMRCAQILPLQEIAPGVVEARLPTGGAQFRVVTKAGGFGSLDVVARIERFLDETRAQKE